MVRGRTRGRIDKQQSSGHVVNVRHFCSTWTCWPLAPPGICLDGTPNRLHMVQSLATKTNWRGPTVTPGKGNTFKSVRHAFPYHGLWWRVWVKNGKMWSKRTYHLCLPQISSVMQRHTSNPYPRLVEIPYRSGQRANSERTFSTLQIFPSSFKDSWNVALA